MNPDSAIWYPFTQLKQAENPIKIVKGEGAFVIDEHGKYYLDAVSSWWVNTLGHCNPVIKEAIKKQVEQLEHVMFAGFTHEPAEQLASEILNMLGNKYQKVFYSDNGSTSVEVAIKMAVQYFYNRGEKRSKIIAFENSYHGDTFGAMSVGARGSFNQAFEHLFFDVQFFPYPSTWIGKADTEQQEMKVLQDLQNYVEENQADIACLIIEPLVQGAGGMNMCTSKFLQKIDHLCSEFGVLLIYDEVMTGFGRTGDVFAHQKAGTSPDFVCLSKGLTGGFLPLSLTVTKQFIFNAFYDDDLLHTFYHGHSYTANPISCAAALATVRELPNYMNEIRRIEELFKSFTEILVRVQQIEKVRQTGTILAFDIKSRESSGYFNQGGKQLKNELLIKGFNIRPLGNVIYLMPPYVTKSKNLKNLFNEILNFFEF